MKKNTMTEAIKGQIATLHESTLGELMRMNYRNISRSELEEILSALETQGIIERSVAAVEPLDQSVKWIKKRRED